MNPSWIPSGLLLERPRGDHWVTGCYDNMSKGSKFQDSKIKCPGTYPWTNIVLTAPGSTCRVSLLSLSSLLWIPKECPQGPKERREEKRKKRKS